MADKSKATHAISLDWSKLLGFDQIRDVAPGEMKLADPRLAKIGTKSCLIAKA